MSGKLYEIDDTKSFDENLETFGERIDELDSALATALKAHLKPLAASQVSNAHVWDALLEAAEKSENQAIAEGAGSK